MSRRSPSVHAVVLAGGSGQRFWPRSRRRHPKPLLRVVDGATLLEATLARARAVASPDATWLVCTHEHATPMRRTSGIRPSRVLVEPRGRNTGMAVALAANRIRAEDPDAVIVVLPADHVIPDTRAFVRAIRKAARAADRERVLVTLGVRPTRPETGYGYIAAGAPAGRAHPGLHRVRRFVEKPDRARARRFLKSGDYAWNAGIFVWRADVILEQIEAHAPTLHRACAPLRARPRSREARELAYRKAPAVPIDIAVLEPSRRVWTLPVDFHWNDVGTWDSLARELGVGTGRSKVVEGSAILDDAHGNLVWPDGRLVVLLGVEGLAVIDTPEALLVARLDRSQDVRRVVERLGSDGHARLT